MICVVCEEPAEKSDVWLQLPGLPDEYVACKGCKEITLNGWQCEQHWLRRAALRERQRAIEEAAKIAFAHLTYLDDCGVLTRKEEPMMQALREALTGKRGEEEL